MKKMLSTALVVGALSAGLAGCSKEEPPPPPPPVEEKKPEPPPPPPAPTIPEYNPMGDLADVKKEAAKDITADNAMDKAKALEADLDKAISELEASKTAKK